MKTNFFLLLFTFLSVSVFAQNMDYGLYIHATPGEEPGLTTLCLENGGALPLDNETTVLSFNMYVRKENVFGFVFRILTDRNESIDLLFSVDKEDKRYPVLFMNDSTHRVAPEVVCEKWFPVSLTLEPGSDRIVLQYDTFRLTAPYPVSRVRNLQVSFGLCPVKGFSLPDIASVNLRDIRVVRNKELIRHWKLEKHGTGVCYDSVRHVPALATNPHWLIDDCASWEKIYSRKINGSPSFAFHPETSRFYIAADSKEITVFDASCQSETHLPVRGGVFVANAPNQLVYNPVDNRLIAYNLDEHLYSFFSFDTGTWSHTSPPSLDHAYWNNTSSFLPADSLLVSFGGYGFYRYNNELLTCNPYTGGYEKKLLEEIHPRYSPASFVSGDTLYLFGGRGCRSGQQELAPHNYYDLYAVDLSSGAVRKCWDIPSVPEEFIPGENMVYDAERNCFYVLTTQSGGSLLKFDTQSGDLQTMSFPIRETLDPQFLYFNLYHSPAEGKLYALFSKTYRDKTSEVSIYTMDYPPVAYDDLFQQVSGTDSEQWGLSPAWLLCFGLFLTVYLGYRLVVHRKKKGSGAGVVPRKGVHASGEGIGVFREEVGLSGKRVTVSGEEVVVSEKEMGLAGEKAVVLGEGAALSGKEAGLSGEGAVPYYPFTSRCICLLGGFLVKDRDGNDITHLFTPMLQSLLFLLILHAEKGISGSHLSDTLWFDKSKIAARNNRNVYLSRLRGLLEKVGDFEIVNKSGLWSIRFGEDVVCDYTEAMRYFACINGNVMPGRDVLSRLPELLLRGTLLPNMEADWIDNFKSIFSNLTIDTMYFLYCREGAGFDDNFKLRIADTIFMHDSINEFALYVKCSTLYHSGKKGLAKSAYDKFCKEYYTLLNTEYKCSLAEVLCHGGKVEKG